LGFFIELNKLEFDKKGVFDFAQPDTWGEKNFAALRLCERHSEAKRRDFYENQYTKG
jgi:hypothetical protein